MKTSVLDKGYVELQSYHASDLDVVNAARVSFLKEHKNMEEGDDKLIAFLMKNRHGTPFEQNFFKFRVKAPLFVFREWHRHRIGVSINEWSARYSELKPEFYIPENVRTQVGKPGAYTYEPAPEAQTKWFLSALEFQSKESFEFYQAAISMGIAKEQARFFLPVNTYSEMIWSCNARSLMNFLSLRNTEKAQYEIRMYAQAMEEMFLAVMPVTAQEFIKNGRIAA